MAVIQQALQATKEAIVEGWINNWQVSVLVEAWNSLW